ncbi:hypothetical protein LEN26_015963 [Aphanomyces euteiches]|nr:hypothetical protein LEN26_015963 [Aphanomyces euteiches]KAH9114902.1 hypothetical protein AeMF1_011038 [Aphanomyces euteiches]
MKGTSKVIHIPRGRFDLNKHSDATCDFNFRLRKNELKALAGLLEIPDPFVTSCCYKAEAVEALCIMLNRLVWPHRLGSTLNTFDRSREELSAIANETMNHVYSRFGHLLQWDEERLDSHWMKACAQAIHAKGAPLDTCIGFIDGTVRGICRPGKDVQKTAYNCHKRMHALKFQSISTPDGLIVHLYGPKPGSRHDSYLLERSQIVPYLQDKLAIDGKRYVIYGDPAYGLNDVIVAGYTGAKLDEYQAEFNKRMCALRLSVEWGFGIVIKHWTMIEYKGGQKLLSRSLGKQYAVAVLLTNIHTCMRGRNQISECF